MEDINRKTSLWPKKSDDENDGCNDNYDDNDGNFDDNDEKITKKHDAAVKYSSTQIKTKM